MSNNNQGQPIGYIICDEAFQTVEFKKKGVGADGYVVAEGVLQRGNEQNRNKRFYPTEELVRAVNSKRTQELITTGNLKGEAGHPVDTSLARQAKIDPTLEQVWYKKLWVDGDYVKGQFTGTSNDLGKSFNEDLRRGQHPSFSLRGAGGLIMENGVLKVRNLQMFTYDRVYWPSHSEAYTTHLVTTEAAGFQEKQVTYYNINPNDYYYAKAAEIDLVCESGNCPVSGNIVTPLTQSEIRDFLIEQSNNVQALFDSTEILYESVNLNPDMQTISAKTRYGDTVVLSLEESINKEIMSGISKLF